MLIFRPEAEADVESAYRWYEDQRSGLGDEFIDAVDAVIAGISRLPEKHPVIYRGMRRALLRRFPYAVCYLLDRDRIIVIAVMHQHVDPGRWQKRQ